MNTRYVWIRHNISFTYMHFAIGLFGGNLSRTVCGVCMRAHILQCQLLRLLRWLLLLFVLDRCVVGKPLLCSHIESLCQCRDRILLKINAHSFSIYLIRCLSLARSLAVYRQPQFSKEIFKWKTVSFPFSIYRFPQLENVPQLTALKIVHWQNKSKECG